MKSREEAGSGTEVQAAIEQVLSTERRAAGALDAAREEARQSVAAAAEQAARIAQRARQRIGAMHERCAHHLAAAIGAIERSSLADATELQCDEARLGRLVERVATGLIRDEHDR
jgi:vacuolar-type H+-ATPase subunit H